MIVATEGRSEVFLNTGSGWTRDASYSASLAGLQAQAIAQNFYFDPNCIPKDEAEEDELT